MKYFISLTALILLPIEFFAQVEYSSEIISPKNKINSPVFYLNKNFPEMVQEHQYLVQNSAFSERSGQFSEQAFSKGLKASSENFKEKLDSMINPERNRDIFKFSSIAKISGYESSKWSNSANTWNNDTREEYIYNNSGNKSSYIVSHWDKYSPKWEYEYKVDYEYDENEILNRSLDYTWDDYSNKWDQIYVVDYLYNENSNLVKKIYSFQNSGMNYMNISKIEYSYNTMGQILNKIEYFWNESGNDWAKHFKEENSYDSNGNLLTYFSFHWDGRNQSWLFQNRTEYFYQIGKINEIIFSNWNNNNETWHLDDMYEYQYDANDNLTSNIYKKWDYEGEGWKSKYKEEYYYDNSLTYENLLLPNFAGKILFNHKVIKGSFFNYSDGIWENSGEVFLYYSTFENNTLVNNSVKHELIVYPNPSSGYVIFHVESIGILDIQIYNIKGELIINQEQENNKPISVEAISPGLYFYRVSSSGIIYQGKFIIN